MSNVLLIGKDLPDGIEFAEGLAGNENKVFTSAKSAAEISNFESENIFASVWNKSSAISAHSMLISAETRLTNINHAVFYFDSNYFCTKFELDKTEELSAAVDSMINSYFYAAGELIKRADQKKEKLIITFLVREYPSKSEVILNPSKTASILPASIIVSSAEAAFESLAQNYASYVQDKEFLSINLAKCSFSNEMYKNEKQIAQWINESYEILSNQKNKQAIKHACNWNKVGSKIQTGFSLFK